MSAAAAAASATPVDWYVTADDSSATVSAIKYVLAELAAPGDTFQLIRALPPKSLPFTNPIGAVGGGDGYAFGGNDTDKEDLKKAEEFRATLIKNTGIDVSVNPTRLHVIVEFKGPKGSARALNTFLQNNVARSKTGHAAVLVSGHHERSTISKVVGTVIGRPASISHSLAKASRFPSVVVPDTAAEKTGPIVVAIDGSDDSQGAVEFAASYLTRGKANAIYLVQVAREGGAAPTESAPAEPTGLARISATLNRLSAGLSRVSAAKHDIDQQVATARKLAPAGVAIESAVLTHRSGTGNVSQAIADYANKQGAALLVVGARGKSAISAALGIGSVSAAVLDRFDGNTLVFKNYERLLALADDEE